MRRYAIAISCALLMLTCLLSAGADDGTVGTVGQNDRNLTRCVKNSQRTFVVDTTKRTFRTVQTPLEQDGPTMTTKTDAPMIAYLRVSTESQGRSGLGLEGQRRMIADLAVRTGRQVVAEFGQRRAVQALPHPCSP